MVPETDSTTRILLAEDDNDMRRFLVKALENAGYQVASFDNGLSAYNRLREEPFELLLTDIVMPEMDGIELARRATELDPDIKVTATCVRVPVFVGHSEAINIEFESPITPDQARDILREAPGCMVVDKREDGGYVTPVECVGDYATYISRIRKDPTVENGLALWCVSDNLRKGAALNAIQIAEILIARHLKKAA